jgi:hypothetical protein
MVLDDFLNNYDQGNTSVIAYADAVAFIIKAHSRNELLNGLKITMDNLTKWAFHQS